jgi:8-oxo-dGTP pyrophosphatase MutT (NUDIX family)
LNETHNPWRRLTRKVAYDNDWIRVWHDDVLRPDGQPGIYGVVHYKNLAVGVVPMDDQDRVLLVGQYRYTLDAYSWEIPEGGCPAGEEPLAAAQRELLEETGYSARQWQELGRVHLSNCISDELAIFYVARDLQPGIASPDPTERLQTRWAPFAEALAMTMDGRITDAVSVLAIQRVGLMIAPTHGHWSGF